MISSHQEKEKLRKRLQKLFQKLDKEKKPVTINPNENSQRKDVVGNNIKKTETPNRQQGQESEVNVNKINSKKQQKRSPTQSKAASKQNGFAKAPGKQKSSSFKKLEGCKLKQDKQANAKLKKNKTSVAIENNENRSLKHKSRSIDTKKSSQQKLNEVEKNSKAKTTSNMNITRQKSEKSNFGNRSGRNPSKSDQTSTLKESSSVANTATKFNKRKTKAKKRLASTDTLQNKSVITEKKQKLAENKAIEKAVNSNQKHEADPNSFSSVLQLDDEYEVDGMTGYVQGGGFDSDYDEDDMEYNYWMEEETYSENESDENITMRRHSQTDLVQYDKNVSSDSEEEYFDSDDKDQDFNDYYSDSYEENGYEENEYSYNYSTDNCYSYFDDCDDDMSTDINDIDSDSDYKLPKHVPEDLIIYKGAAITRDLKPSDNFSFDSENEKSQIVELKKQCTVKSIYQPEACEKEELLKLTYKAISSSALKFNKKRTPSNDLEDCPELVPIIDEDGFQPYNTNENVSDEEEQAKEENEQHSMDEYETESMDDVSLGSEYTEINSDEADSFLSEDINEKYLNRSYDDISSDYSIDETIWNKSGAVEVIDATCCKYENKTDHDHSNISLNDDIRQIASRKLHDNVDLTTECSVLGTTIIDNKIFMSNATELGANTSEAQKVSSSQIEENETEPKVIKSTGKNSVKYNTKFFNAFDSNTVMVLLKDPFYIYGTTRLTLLAGTVEVYGHSLVLNTEVELFSPRGCSMIEISSSNAKTNISNENLKEILKAYEQHFALADLNKVAKLFDCEADAVVLLKRNEGRKKVVEQFKKFMNENVFPNINNISMDRSLYNSEYLLRCLINTSIQEEKCLRLPKQWQQLNITSNSRVMLTGGKGVGKSTLLRYLINRHLPQKILLIDLDIGQPEVFIPQTISCTIVKQPLLGPGFFLNIQPEIAYAVGHTNIVLCAHKYIAATRSLIAHCKAQEEYKEIPWLINTMGYNKGFGLELISVIAQELSLTDIIQLQSTKDINNFDGILHPHVLSSVPRIFFAEYGDAEKIMEKLNYRLHVWQSAVEQKSRYQKEWEMSPKDLRFSMFLVRLSEALQGHADWLTDIKPFCASLNDLKILNLTDNTPSASVEQMAKTIEANLVYLCHYEEDFKPLKCLGIGIVRAIDFHVQQLYLIPAMPNVQLKDVNCVAIGEFPLPTSLFTNQGSNVKNTAPFVYKTIAANASKAIKQIYHRPHKFLTGKHINR